MSCQLSEGLWLFPALSLVNSAVFDIFVYFIWPVCAPYTPRISFSEVALLRSSKVHFAHFWVNIQKELKAGVWTGICTPMYTELYSQQPKGWSTQVCIYGWMDTQKVLCPYNGTYFRLQKARNSDTCYNMMLSEISQTEKDKYERIPLM